MSTGTENNPASGGNGGAEQKVTFTPEQQAKVQEIVDAAVGRAGAPFKAQASQLETEKTQLQSQLQDLQNQLKTLKATGAGNGDEATTLKAQIEEMRNAGRANADALKLAQDQLRAAADEAKNARSETTNVRKSVAIQKAVASHNFVNTEIVEQLTDKFIKVGENGKLVVVNEDGTPRVNAAFEPMTLAEFYQEYAAKNPYLVRSDLKPGLGTTQNARFDVTSNGKLEVKQIFGKESNAKLANELKRQNPQEYARLRKIAVDGGLLAG
jgi:uncharacterized protein YukE